MNKRIEKYNIVIRELSRRHNCSSLRLDCGPDDFYDGVHPTGAGALNLAGQIASFILEKRGLTL